jgi:peptidoglycan/LPS O-acetylase OafA/YrhL
VARVESAAERSKLSHRISKYRPDIDGLRAIAVLSVIVFHINKAFLPGGFVGVDVFFVISGYLITNNIVQKMGSGQFSIVDFYRSRIKRIAPAMMTVIGASLIVATAIMLPDDAATMAKSAVWSLASFANVFFWLYQDTSYFAASSQQQPLLHLWSLGVEEQFYLIWPLLLMCVYRPGREKRMFIGGLCIAGLSFALGSLYFVHDSAFVYYMLPARAGELLMGALVALLAQRGAHHRIPGSVVGPLATLGLLLLGVSLAYLSEDAVFPGVLAIPPTLGAALVILAGNCRSSWVARGLAWKPLVWLGLVSYSAYLWHWPLLAFYRYGFGQIGLFAGVTLFGLTLLLAWLTFRFVEQPARHVTSSALIVFTRQFVMPAGVLFAIALGSIYIDRIWPAHMQNSYRQQLAGLRDQTRPAFSYDYVCQRQKITAEDTDNEHCVVGAGDVNAPNILLWGDSNAAHYIGMLGAFANKANFRFRNVEVGSCPPILDDPASFVDARRLADCRASTLAIQPLLRNANVVIISAFWPGYQLRSSRFLNTFLDTVRGIAKSGKLVILIGKAPDMDGFDRLCRLKELRFPFLTCPEIKLPLSAEVTSLNATLRQFAQATTNVRYFDATRYLCPNGYCPAYGHDGVALYFDQSHLSMSGSWKLGNRIVGADGVPEVFRSLSDWHGPLQAESTSER